MEPHKNWYGSPTSRGSEARNRSCYDQGRLATQKSSWKRARFTLLPILLRASSLRLIHPIVWNYSHQPAFPKPKMIKSSCGDDFGSIVNRCDIPLAPWNPNEQSDRMRPQFCQKLHTMGWWSGLPQRGGSWHRACSWTRWLWLQWHRPGRSEASHRQPLYLWTNQHGSSLVTMNHQQVVGHHERTIINHVIKYHVSSKSSWAPLWQRWSEPEDSRDEQPNRHQQHFRVKPVMLDPHEWTPIFDGLSPAF